MLRSNPTADSVDSTDRNGSPSASPFHLRVEAPSGEAAKRESWGAGAKPLRPSLLPLRKPASSDNACIIANALVDSVPGAALRMTLLLFDTGSAGCRLAFLHPPIGLGACPVPARRRAW